MDHPAHRLRKKHKGASCPHPIPVPAPLSSWGALVEHSSLMQSTNHRANKEGKGQPFPTAHTAPPSSPSEPQISLPCVIPGVMEGLTQQPKAFKSSCLQASLPRGSPWLPESSHAVAPRTWPCCHPLSIWVPPTATQEHVSGLSRAVPLCNRGTWLNLGVGPVPSILATFFSSFFPNDQAAPPRDPDAPSKSGSGGYRACPWLPSRYLPGGQPLINLMNPPG